MSLEIFDWDSQNIVRKVAHVKGYFSFEFFEHIYAVAGIDDPTRIDIKTGNKDNSLNMFFGAGLSFDDDDLRTLFGVAALAR